VSSQDGYDWPNGCQDEQWPTGAEQTQEDEQRERNAKWLRDMLDSSKYP